MITAETVNGIVRFQANGLPVVSLYCRVDPGASQREVRARVDSLLGQIRPLAKDRDLDHRSRLSVRTDIERIKDALDSERWPPGTIAIFSCSGRGLYEEIPLPRRVREQVMVDKTLLARPMLAVLGEYPRACVLVINREAAPVWEMYQDEMREVETVTDPLRKAGNTGGSRPEDRIQNWVDEQAKRHFRRAASMIDQLLRSDGYDILVVGGHEYELGEFFRLLPHELRGRVAGTFSADPSPPRWPRYVAAPGVMRRYQLPCVMPRPDRNEFRLVEWQGAKYATCSEGCEWIFRTWPVAHAGRRQFWARYHGWDLADVIEDLGYVRPDGRTLIGQPALDLDRLWTIDDIRAIGFEVKDPLA